MKPLYIHSYQAVNKKGRQFISSLILLSIEIYLFANKYVGNYFMMLQSNAHQALILLGLSKSQIFSYNTLLSEYPINERFHTYPMDSLEQKLKLKARQIRNHLSVFCALGLAKKEYDTLQIEERDIGNVLYVTITPPAFLVKTLEPETMDNMTLFAKFEKIEEKTYKHFGTKKTAMFKDVYNIAQTICINHTWHDLKDDDFNSRALEKIGQDEQVCFQARVKKTNNGYYISNIHNIKKSCE